MPSGIANRGCWVYVTNNTSGNVTDAAESQLQFSVSGGAIPEAPIGVLLPVSAAVVAAGGFLFLRQRQRAGQAVRPTPIHERHKITRGNIIMKLKTLAAGVLAASITFGTAGAAMAAPPGSGWDGVPDKVEGSGSDTTYAYMQKVELLFNQAQGCDTDNTAGSANVGKCLVPASPDETTTFAKQGNWDHDYFVGRYPSGSTAGIRQLQGIGGSADYARSSRPERHG